MALTETQVEDKIEVVGDHKHVQIRTDTVIARDGTEISTSFTSAKTHYVAQTNIWGQHGVTLTSQVSSTDSMYSNILRGMDRRSEDCIPDSRG